MKINKIRDRLSGLEGRLLEDEIYRIVWEEIESGIMDQVSQARSVAEGDGDDGKIRAAYIRHRVRRIKDEMELRATQKRSREDDSGSAKNTNNSTGGKGLASCAMCGTRIRRTGYAGLCWSCWALGPGSR